MNNFMREIEDVVKGYKKADEEVLLTKFKDIDESQGRGIFRSRFLFFFKSCIRKIIAALRLFKRIITRFLPYKFQVFLVKILRPLGFDVGENFYSHLSFVARYEKKDLAPSSVHFNKSALRIHFVIPDFNPGDGGHMTIFRVVKYLENFGHEVTLWIQKPEAHSSPSAAFNTIRESFQPLQCRIEFLESSLSRVRGDVVIATDRWTVYPVAAMKNFKARFYFVQDFEPYFFPVGAEYYLTENTYKLGLDCLCAGNWLKARMEQYGLWARAWELAFDPLVYYPPGESETRQEGHIAFYSRLRTARRCVEIGMLALDLLAASGQNFHVHFFGEDMSGLSVDYEFTDHGVLTPLELGSLYRKCSAGMVFSGTNYSLIPNEMMACGLPVLELNVEGISSEYPKGIMEMVDPHPAAVMKGLRRLLNDKSLREQMSLQGEKFVKSLSWEKSARTVERAIIERLDELYPAQNRKVSRGDSNPTSNVAASVVIPSLNGGELFKDVLQALLKQEFPGKFEVLIIDSGSTDGTVEYVKSLNGVRLHEISKEDFGHGKTRNLGVELTSGEFIAFLTQDALPYDEHWLKELVKPLELNKAVAGVFGQHYAYPDADAFTRRDLTNHFKNLAKYPLLNRETDAKRYNSTDASWRQILHFYSDNNSCMRRSVWEEIPYPEIEYGEDQVWADLMIEAGYSKAYAQDAIVYHSHNYDFQSMFDRSVTEGDFFNREFSYELCPSPVQLVENVVYLNRRDKKYARKNGMSNETLENRMKNNIAQQLGYLTAYTKRRYQ